MAKKSQMKVVMTKQGFFVGTVLKNGELSKDARRITEKEIMQMFMHMFSAYCAQNNTDTLLIKGAEDYHVLVKELPVLNTEKKT